MGKAKEYRTAKALRAAIEAYWDSISYLEEENGKQVRRFVTPPCEAGMLLAIGMKSRAAWADAARDETLGPVVEEWRLMYEAYLVTELETSKHPQGIIRNLEMNFGWHRSVDISGDGSVRITVEGADEEASE